MNTQVYVVKPDGTGMKLLTQGGKDNNSFDEWTEDGKQIAIDSNRNDPASRDAFMIDLSSGETRLVAKNPGVGSIDGISRDGKRALLGRGFARDPDAVPRQHQCQSVREVVTGVRKQRE